MRKHCLIDDTDREQADVSRHLAPITARESIPRPVDTNFIEILNCGWMLVMVRLIEMNQYVR